MTEYKRYNDFILEEAKNKEIYRFLLNDIQIDVNILIDELKDKFNMSCWFLYSHATSLSLEYYQSSDDSAENMMKIKKYLFDALPYFRDLSWYDDDRRIVLKFIEVGDPVRFKFYH